MLGLSVLGAVLIVTIVFALVAYLIDKGEERLESTELGDKGFDTARENGKRLES